MSSKTRTFFLSLTIIAILVFSAFGTTAAFADDGDNPETPPAQTSGCESDEDEDADQSACADESEEGDSSPQATETATSDVVEATPAPLSDASG